MPLTSLIGSRWACDERSLSRWGRLSAAPLRRQRVRKSFGGFLDALLSVLVNESLTAVRLFVRLHSGVNSSFCYLCERSAPEALFGAWVESAKGQRPIIAYFPKLRPADTVSAVILRFSSDWPFSGAQDRPGLVGRSPGLHLFIS